MIRFYTIRIVLIAPSLEINSLDMLLLGSRTIKNDALNLRILFSSEYRMKTPSTLPAYLADFVCSYSARIFASVNLNPSPSPFLKKECILHKRYMPPKTHAFAWLVQGLFAACRINLSMVASRTRQRRWLVKDTG